MFRAGLKIFSNQTLWWAHFGGVNGCNSFVVVQCRPGLDCRARPKDWSRVRRQAQKPVVFMAEIRALGSVRRMTI